MNDQFNIHKWFKQQYEGPKRIEENFSPDMLERLKNLTHLPSLKQFNKSSTKIVKELVTEGFAYADVIDYLKLHLLNSTESVVTEELLKEDFGDSNSIHDLSVEAVSDHVLQDIRNGYYDIGDAIQTLRYAYMKASQENPAWIAEYEKFKQIRDIFDSMETGRVL